VGVFGAGNGEREAVGEGGSVGLAVGVADIVGVRVSVAGGRAPRSGARLVANKPTQ
jgi:hypothetical protein